MPSSSCCAGGGLGGTVGVVDVELLCRREQYSVRQCRSRCLDGGDEAVDVEVGEG